MPFFLDHRGEIRTIWADDGTRLRIGQLGAVWAAASHFTVSGEGIARLTTQMYVAGAPENRRDAILNRIRDPRARESVIVRLEPDAAHPDELVGRFDIVLAADGRYQSG